MHDREAEQQFRVTLLGTGMPRPDPARYGPSTLIEAGGKRILVDAGRGATMRLFQLGVPIGSIDTLLLTHFHSDHVVGIPDIWLTGWLGGKFGRRSRPFQVIGPPGTIRLMRHLRAAYMADIEIRIADEALPEAGAQIEASEFERDGTILEHGSLKISCFEVDHGDLIKPAYGYRFDFAGHSAVFSGDTRFNENLIKNAEGTDLLVHEVAMACPDALEIERVRRVINHHSTPKDAASVFARVQPGLAVYNHIVLLGSDSQPAPDRDALMIETRKYYGGPLTIGEDLMSFDVVHVARTAASANSETDPVSRFKTSLDSSCESAQRISEPQR